MGKDIFSLLQERGFVAQVTDETALRTMLASGPVVFYNGYDPTADSLHVGNLLTLMALKHLENAGHRPLVLLGGGTARVGDPSGKTEMRQLLDTERILANLAALRRQVSRFFAVESGQTRIVDNGDWLLSLSYIDFLRDIGRHFSVNRMLAAEAYKQRLEKGLSFIEFNYQLLQAYDFLELRRRYDCQLQLGGDDQWGNILAGIDLCRRVDQTLVHGLTFPLLTTATGEKMGKSAGGAIWLDADKVAPFDYYQYWVNVHDADVERMLGFFTFLPMDEVHAVAQLSGAALNLAKSVLAFEATRIWHGIDAALEAHRAAQGAFGGRALPDDLFPSSAVPRGGGGDDTAMPSTILQPTELALGLSLVELLVRVALAPSKKEARRLIEQGAVRLDEAIVRDSQFTVKTELFANGPVVLRAGKKRVHRLVLAASR